MTDWWKAAPLAAPASGENWWSEAPLANAEPQQDPEQRMYEARARYMREKNPTMTRVRDVATRLVEGTPIGSFFDEAMAGLSSVINGQPYAEAKGVLDADRRIRDAESTKLATFPVIGDVTAGGVQKLAGGIATAAAAPVARVFQGQTMLPRIGNMALSGAGYGTLYGAGEGNTTGERAQNAMFGGGIGAGLGFATPLVAEGAGNAMARLLNRPQMPQRLQGYDPAAVRRVAETIQREDIPQNEIRYRLRNLGNEGMLADVGENLTTVTEGLAQQPGTQQRVINEALQTRARGAGQRITQDLNTHMGHPTNVTQTIDAMRQQTRQMAQPLYEQFYNTQIPVDQELVSILQAVPDSVWPRVRTLMQADRIDPTTPVNTGRGIDLIKRALDDAARAAGRGTNEERIFANLSRDLRNHVDNLISPNDPAASPWAQARHITGEELGAREAIQQGETLFTRGQDPVQTAADLAGMSQLEQEAYRLGARSNLRNVMGRAATNFGPSGDRVARRALNSEFNRQNLAQLEGRQAADAITARIDAENAMADTANTVMGNSATARRQAARNLIPRQYEASQMRELRGSSVTGLVAEGVGRIANILTAGALNERNGRIARDMAEMLVAQGANRRDIVNGLFQYIRSQRLPRQQREAIAQVARDILRGSQQQVIDQATTP